MSKRKKINKKHKLSTAWISIIISSVSLLILMCELILIVMNQNKEILEVTHLIKNPYTLNEFKSNHTNVIDDKMLIEYRFENNTDNDILLNSVKLDISNIKQSNAPDIFSQCNIDNNILYVDLFNKGWEEASNIHIQLTDDFVKGIYKNDELNFELKNLKIGERKTAFKLDLNKLLSSEIDNFELNYTLFSNENSYRTNNKLIKIVRSDNEFHILGQGGGAGTSSSRVLIDLENGDNIVKRDLKEKIPAHTGEIYYFYIYPNHSGNFNIQITLNTNNKSYKTPIYQVESKVSSIDYEVIRNEIQKSTIDNVLTFDRIDSK